MGTTNNIRETNITLKLDDKECPQCQQKFTQQDIDERNFEPWFDTSNDVILNPIGKGYEFAIWIRSIEHQACPEKAYE
ncbi:MAG: Mycothiol acetyltransferase [Mycoplasmataceae bacterium]|nr:MAG: Mycothiol acetyltransferase [Mycoplasmataceae bacterium]